MLCDVFKIILKWYFVYYWGTMGNPWICSSCGCGGGGGGDVDVTMWRVYVYNDLSPTTPALARSQMVQTDRLRTWLFEDWPADEWWSLFQWIGFLRYHWAKQWNFLIIRNEVNMHNNPLREWLEGGRMIKSAKKMLCRHITPDSKNIFSYFTQN